MACWFVALFHLLIVLLPSGCSFAKLAVSFLLSAFGGEDCVDEDERLLPVHQQTLQGFFG